MVRDAVGEDHQRCATALALEGLRHLGEDPVVRCGSARPADVTDDRQLRGPIRERAAVEGLQRRTDALIPTEADRRHLVAVRVRGRSVGGRHRGDEAARKRLRLGEGLVDVHRARGVGNHEHVIRNAPLTTADLQRTRLDRSLVVERRHASERRGDDEQKTVPHLEGGSHDSLSSRFHGCQKRPRFRQEPSTLTLLGRRVSRSFHSGSAPEADCRANPGVSTVCPRTPGDAGRRQDRGRSRARLARRP